MLTEASALPQPRAQANLYVIGLGHAGTHWILSTFFILLPYLTHDLGLSYTAAGALVSVLHVSSLAGNLSSGALVDLTGRRGRLLAISLTATAAALLLLGASRVYVLIALMAGLIGAANNMWHPPAVAMLSRQYPRRRSFALAIHATGASVGDMTGPLAAGALLLVVGWQGTAALATLPVFAIALYFWLVMPPREAGEDGVQAAPRRGGAYLRNMAQLLRRRTVLVLCLLAAVRSMAQTGLTVFLPLYLANVLKVSPFVVGAAIMAIQAGSAVMSPVSGMLGDRFGPRPVIMAGLSASTLIIVGLTFIRAPALYVGTVALIGFLLYSVRPVLLAWLMDLAPAELRGSATSVMFAGQSALAVVMPLLGGLVADRFGLLYVFYVIAGIILLANALLFAMPPNDAPAPAAP
jgi:MFS transporter, FSR family, fosmidomycin resistance protein